MEALFAIVCAVARINPKLAVVTTIVKAAIIPIKTIDFIAM
jgi:hypothetical protein